MKKLTKLIAILFLSATALISCLSLTSCEMLGLSSGSAKVDGVYLSPAEMSYNNMRPSYNYYLTTFTQQELTLYDDGTYCLIVSSSQFSAVVLPEEGNTASANERANYITKYYGKYTSAVNELDTDLIDISLESPTRIVKNNDSEYFVDTDNWTENMGTLTKKPSGIDMATGRPTYDPNTPNQTAEGYLALNAFKATKAQANTKKAQLDYITLEFAE